MAEEEKAAPPAGKPGGGFMAKLRANFEKHKNLYAIGLAVAGLALTWYIYKHSTGSTMTTTDTTQNNPTGTTAPTIPITPPGSTGGGGGTVNAPVKVPVSTANNGPGGGTIPSIPTGTSAGDTGTPSGGGVNLRTFSANVQTQVFRANILSEYNQVKPIARMVDNVKAAMQSASNIRQAQGIADVVHRTFNDFFQQGTMNVGTTVGAGKFGGTGIATRSPISTTGGSLNKKGTTVSKVLHPTTVTAVTKTMSPVVKSAPVVLHPVTKAAPVVKVSAPKSTPVAVKRVNTPAPVIHRAPAPPVLRRKPTPPPPPITRRMGKF